MKGKNWKVISEKIGTRSPIQCLHRWKKNLMPGLIKGPWSISEDRCLLQFVCSNGTKHWSKCAKFIKGRSGKQCRERYIYTLAPTVNKENWTPEEDFIVFKNYIEYGGKWANIANLLEGRTDNSVKNRFYSTLRKCYNKISWKEVREKRINNDSNGIFIVVKPTKEHKLQDLQKVLPDVFAYIKNEYEKYLAKKNENSGKSGKDKKKAVNIESPKEKTTFKGRCNRIPHIHNNSLESKEKNTTQLNETLEVNSAPINNNKIYIPSKYNNLIIYKTKKKNVKKVNELYQLLDLKEETLPFTKDLSTEVPQNINNYQNYNLNNINYANNLKNYNNNPFQYDNIDFDYNNMNMQNMSMANLGMTNINNLTNYNNVTNIGNIINIGNMNSFGNMGNIGNLVNYGNLINIPYEQYNSNINLGNEGIKNDLYEKQFINEFINLNANCGNLLNNNNYNNPNLILLFLYVVDKFIIKLLLSLSFKLFHKIKKL